jgi:pimeloyl-ACP methyl ester carboxylesterase
MLAQKPPEKLSDEGFLDVAPLRLEYRMIGPRPDAAPTIVMLHEGLGSAGLWNSFPDHIASATGAGVFAYSRAGYGQSPAGKLPRSTSFLNEEASIAAIYAGSIQDHRVRGLVLIAPHFFTEEKGLAEIRRAGKSFATGALRERLAPWHADVDAAFRSWNEPWTHPDFEKWDITDALGYIRVPILVVQGADDQYGTLRQVEIVKEECTCPVETAILPGIRHVPQREAPELTLEAIAGFINRLLRDHHEGERPVDSGVAAS